MRKLGVDPGLRRVGLALSDEEGELASPLGTLGAGKPSDVARALAEEAARHQVDTVVMGLPLRLDGAEGPEARRVRQLAAHLAQCCPIRVVLWDERMTTLAAERQLRASGLRGPKKRARIDEAAATLLLQSYLDAQTP